MTDEAAPGPSARSAQRLAAAVGGEVDDLRARLHRALDEAGRLEAEGRQDLAAAVLEEQRETLLAVHRRLQGRLADAAVEREAERVVAHAAPTDGGGRTSTPAATAQAPTAMTAPDGPMSTAVRMLAAVAAAAVGVVLLVTPDLGSAVLTVAGWTSAVEAEPPGAVTDPADQTPPPGSGPATHDASPSTQDAEDPAAPDEAVRVGGGGERDRADEGGPSATPESPQPGADGTDDTDDLDDRGHLTHLADIPGLVREWIDGVTDADGAAADEGREQDTSTEAPSILPPDRSDDAESGDTASDDRVLGGR